jgi:hypothetical protein
MRPTILGFDGKPVVLNALEQRIADVNQKVVNALGFEIDITTLTTIVKKVTEQKFFNCAPADFMPVRVGQGAWSAQLTTYRSYQIGDDFEKGNINTGGQNGRLASTTAGIDSLTVPVINWAKEIGWTLFDIQQAAKSGNWDLITELEKSRKTNFDLGVQKIAFLGSSSNSQVLGFLTQAGVTVDTTTITAPVSSMTTAQFKTFTSIVLGKYRANCNHTAMPSILSMPEDDFLGLVSPVSQDFPNISGLEYLTKAFKVATGNPNFEIRPCAYNNGSVNGLGYNYYVLSNYDESSIRMDLPVDYTNTLANSVNNFSYQNVAYAQYTGVLAYRPQELYYMTTTST